MIHVVIYVSKLQAMFFLYSFSMNELESTIYSQIATKTPVSKIATRGRQKIYCIWLKRNNKKHV